MPTINLKMEALTTYSCIVCMKYLDGIYEVLGILYLPEGE